MGYVIGIGVIVIQILSTGALIGILINSLFKSKSLI